MSLELPYRPIFVIGSERSGTTLAMAMLGNHPSIAVPEVAWFYPRFRPYLFTYGDLNEPKNFRVLAEEMIFGLKTPFWGMDVNPATIVDEIVAAAREKSFAGLYCAMLERYAQSVGKTRWGEKTPHNLFFVEEILQDFPKAQFIFITRDGRDSSSEYLRSAFGPTNIFCAAEIWKACQNAVKPWRARLDKTQWLDVRYEDLVSDPHRILKEMCEFLGEPYDDSMLEFHTSEIAQRRGKTRDHGPLGSPVSTRYIGRYKRELSLEQQEIFAAVASAELVESGYALDVQPAKLSETDIALFRERDARTRAALLDAPDGHIVYESYNDWLVDQREDRKRRGVWSEHDVPNRFPIAHELEEEVAGYRAPRQWKEYFCIKRQYVSKGVVL